MLLMLVVAACYTMCALSDKYTVAKLKFDGNTFTFLMAIATAFFMLFYLPFDSRLFTLTWQSFATVAAMVILKLLEFRLVTVVLREMSAFELKAWIGVTLFLSFATDLITGVSVFGSDTLIRTGFIAVTIVGLFLIVKVKGKKINYKKIMLPLIFYLLVKYGYGLLVNRAKVFISPTLSLFFALVILTVVLAPKVHPIKLFREKTRGTLFVSITKIPNVIGLICESIVASRSITDYSFIQPMILVALFVIQLIRREECAPRNIIGGVICIIGILGFQLVKVFA